MCARGCENRGEECGENGEVGGEGGKARECVAWRLRGAGEEFGGKSAEFAPGGGCGSDEPAVFREAGAAGAGEWGSGRGLRDSAGGADEEGEGDAEEGEGASCDAAEEVQRVGEESGVMCLLEKLSVAGRVSNIGKG